MSKILAMALARRDFIRKLHQSLVGASGEWLKYRVAFRIFGYEERLVSYWHDEAENIILKVAANLANKDTTFADREKAVEEALESVWRVWNDVRSYIKKDLTKIFGKKNPRVAFEPTEDDLREFFEEARACMRSEGLIK